MGTCSRNGVGELGTSGGIGDGIREGRIHRGKGRSTNIVVLFTSPLCMFLCVIVLIFQKLCHVF